jgi:hypothetical protein
MRARALVVMSILPIALAVVPSAAHAQRSRDCWSYSEWRDWNSCIRRRTADDPSVHRAAMIDRDRARAAANAARDAARRASAAARVESQAWARERARLDREDRDRARADARAYRRRPSYTRWW